MTPKQRAVKSAETMLTEDSATRWFGMSLLEVDEGVAVLCMPVDTHHANGHGICHGGVIFSLADSAFAVACNSRNQTTVAQHNSISFIKPANVGDVLTAHAVETQLTGRNGITDVTIKNQNNETVAVFRGASRAISGPLFKESVTS